MKIICQLMSMSFAVVLFGANEISTQNITQHTYDSSRTRLILYKSNHLKRFSKTENRSYPESDVNYLSNSLSKRKIKQHQFDKKDQRHLTSQANLFQTKETYALKNLTRTLILGSEDKLGGHLEHISIHCNSLTLSKMKYIISDLDVSVETKIISMAISSVAVGCPITALYLTNLLLENERKTNLTGLTINEGPQEKISTSCDKSKAEYLRTTLKANKMYSELYELLAPALFLSLKCDSIGKIEFGKFVKDFKLSTSQRQRITNRNIMTYLNQRKFQLSVSQNLLREEQLGDKPTGTNSTGSNRNTRSIDTNNIEKLFIVHAKCAISRPLGEALNSISKFDCLQLCLDEDSCKSVSYKNDNSKACHLNTENRQDVGTFFLCGKASTADWDYFEKIASVDYFSISNKATAMVIEAKQNFNVIMKTYTGEDNQLWHWDGDAIRSKRYPSSLLKFYILDTKLGLGKVYSSSFQSSSKFKWNFENNHLTSQYNNRQIHVIYASREEGADVEVSRGDASLTTQANQQWSLSFERLYFIITSRFNGKVLEAQISTTGKVHLAMFTGDNNQLWFWDDENIRNKQFQDKVLDLHVADYKANKWGKVYLHPYHTGKNQKWSAEGDLIISHYQNLPLDVKIGGGTDGNLVGCTLNNRDINQKWNLAFSRPYFFIINKESGKVLDATSPTTIELWHYTNTDQQMWFWDGDVLRNKKYANKVIDLRLQDYLTYHWGKISLNEFHNGDNQKWKFDNNILFTKFQNLSLSVKSSSQSDGSEIGSNGVTNHKWSLQPQHDFFIISSRLHAKVLDAPSAHKVIIWSYHGKDNQLWFMDEESIRSKKYPNKVLDLHMANYYLNGWGNVYLHFFNDGTNQKWKMEGDLLVSQFKNLQLEIKDENLKDGAVIGGYFDSGKLSQKWSFNPKERAYFTMKGVGSGKFVNAESNMNVAIWSKKEKDNQLWFFDGDCIRSKKYPRTVLDLHVRDYKRNSWGKIYLHEYHGGSNQLWTIQEENIISNYRQLRMDVKYSKISDGSLIGGYSATGKKSQNWILALHQTSAKVSKSSCIDKTEQKIYEVVQYVPLIGTVWDLFSSIGYAGAGCTRVAEERLISFGIGTIMDVATVFTGGAAAGAATAIKAGLKVGIKFGLKQGMRATLLVTKQSIKGVVKTMTKQGVKSSIKRGGKLVIQEVIVDPALFLKNAGKISKRIFIHPKSTLRVTWKAARHNIDDLKRMTKRLKDDPSFHKLRCRRGNFLSCQRPKSKLYATETQKLMIKSLGDDSVVSERITRSAQRYMAHQGGTIEGELNNAPKMVKEKINSDHSELEKAEVWAIYQYTKTSAPLNSYAASISKNQPVFKTSPPISPLTRESEKVILDSVDNIVDQADLVQSYITKHPHNSEITVYRWESGFENYDNIQVYHTYTFKSTTIRHERFSDQGLDLTNLKKYPIEMKINLKKSGAKISDLSKYQSQEEYLLPIGIKFDVHVKEPDPNSAIRIVTLTEIVE